MAKDDLAKRFASARIRDIAESEEDEKGENGDEADEKGFVDEKDIQDFDDGITRVIAPPSKKKQIAEAAVGFYEATPSAQAVGYWFVANRIGKTPRGVPLYNDEKIARQIAAGMNDVMKTVGRYVSEKSKSPHKATQWSNNVE